MTVGSFTSVSLDPPLVAFFPDRTSKSWAKIKECGRFCVNVLGADQEDVCRRFASKADDKFAGLDWRATSQGSPLIDGVLAWIDCELDAVHEAGDHFIVVGRVRELDVEVSSLPLLFFRGGYGRFTPQSLATSDLDLIERFRHLDLVRPELETLAATAGVECNAAVRVGDQTAILATAGRPSSRHLPTRVGHRYRMIPPVGALFVAWEDEDAQDAWLRQLGPAPQALTEHYRTSLATLRECGYAFLTGYLAEEPIDPTTAARSAARDIRHFVRDVDIGFAAETLADHGANQWAIISAPVFDAAGRVELMISLYGFERLDAGSLRRHTRALTAAAERVTEAVGGAAPS